jgi:MFS family permease
MTWRGPERRLLAATLVNSLGNGLWYTGGAIFLVRSVGLAPAEVGVALAVAALVGLAAGVPIGDVADRLGIRTTFVSTLLVEAAGALALLAVRSVWSFGAVAVLVAVGRQGSRITRGTYIGLLGGPEARARLRAYQRSANNLGLSLGALLGGVVLAIDTRPGYDAMIVLNGLTFLVTAAVMTRMPPVAHPAREGAPPPRWTALRDRGFLAVVALDGVASVHYAVLEVTVPLWVATRTLAPRWIVAILLVVNTGGVVLMQVRAARGVNGPAAAAASVRRAGLLLALAFPVYALSEHRAPVAAVALLIAATAGHTLAEVWHAAGGFELGYALAEPRALGQYQGVFGLGQGAGQALGPALANALCLAWGAGGWLVLSALMLSVALAIRPVVARTAAHRSLVLSSA